MGGGACVLWRVGRSSRGQDGGQALIEQLDRDGHAASQMLGEGLRLARLLAVLAAQGERQADDDLFGLLLGDQGEQTLSARLCPDLFHDGQRTGDEAARIRDGDSRHGRSVIERKHLHCRRF